MTSKIKPASFKSVSDPPKTTFTLSQNDTAIIFQDILYSTVKDFEIIKNRAKAKHCGTLAITLTWG